MITFKQLEAFYWIVRMGGFAQAAEQLNATQAAISKRIQELENTFNMPLFDRSHRTATLTSKGEEFFTFAEQLLLQRDEALEQFCKPEILVKRLRLGVTELTALTWLPQFIQRTQEAYPKVALSVEIDMGINLSEKVKQSQLDLAFLPHSFDSVQLSEELLSEVACSWVCKPGLVDDSNAISVATLAENFTMISQGKMSGTENFFKQWMAQQKISVNRLISCNSLAAVVGMAVSGLGVGYVPHESFLNLVNKDVLHVIQTEPSLPKVPYVAAWRSNRSSGFLKNVVQIAKETCDFSKSLQF